MNRSDVFPAPAGELGLEALERLVGEAEDGGVFLGGEPAEDGAARDVDAVGALGGIVAPSKPCSPGGRFCGRPLAAKLDRGCRSQYGCLIVWTGAGRLGGGLAVAAALMLLLPGAAYRSFTPSLGVVTPSAALLVGPPTATITVA